MLIRKMLREMRREWGQAISVFLLAFLAVAMYCTFAGHVLSQHRARAAYHDACRLSDLWVYGEGFDQEQLEAVRGLDFVEAAQLRTSVTGSAPDCDGAQVDIYLERENLVNQPYYIEGEEFDPSDQEGLWLTNAFAQRRGIQVGDEFTVEYNGVTFTRTVRGLIESAEYEFRQADGDADMYLENIAFVYMSYDAFPVREYVTHLIRQEKLTWETIAENGEALGDAGDVLELLGEASPELSRELLLLAVNGMEEERLASLMPYTELIIRTADGGGLAWETEVDQALESDYAVMLDASSIQGIARLDSELSQHEVFSYVGIIIFAGIAILVISTSATRMVESQRTQIGTMNALGMRWYKVMFHYISGTLFLSLAGAAAGALVGGFVLSPLMISLFAQWYIVPGLKVYFDISYVLIGLAVTAACGLSSYLSCCGILRIRPAQALRPAPPKNGKHCIFERLPFWDRLSFSMQYNLRDISRAKLRAGMCVLGTAVGMLLMVYGVGCGQLVDEMLKVSFTVQSGEWQMKLSEDASLSELDKLSDSLRGELMMTSAVEVAKEENTTAARRQTGTLLVLEGKGFYNLLDEDQRLLTLEPGSIGISRKMAEEQGIRAGDEIYWHLYTKNEWHKSRVGLIYQSSETQGIACLREDLEAAGETFTPTWMFTDEDPSAFAGESQVVSVSSREELAAAFRKSMEVVSLMVWMMLLFAVVLILVVLYNSGNLSFHERIREFATLKVLGMQSDRIRGILSVQNFWLSLVGVLVGAPFGNLSFNVMMNANGDNFDYNISLPLWCYVAAALLVLAVSVLISFLFSKRIRRLDMVEVLKGVE